jgi:hypothetical protein
MGVALTTPTMPKLSAPQSRRQVPEADTRSVEEVVLHRRLAQLRGEPGNFSVIGGELPTEVLLYSFRPLHVHHSHTPI